MGSKPWAVAVARWACGGLSRCKSTQYANTTLAHAIRVLILGQPGPKFVLGKVAIDGGFSFQLKQQPDGPASQGEHLDTALTPSSCVHNVIACRLSQLTAAISSPAFVLSLGSPSARHSFRSPTGSFAPLEELIAQLKRLQATANSLSAFPAGHSHRWLSHYSLTPLFTPLTTSASATDVLATGTISSSPLTTSPTKSTSSTATTTPKWLQSPSLLQRFNSVSSAYSMRSVASTAASSLRSGLGAIDWEQGRGGPVDSPDLAALEEERERQVRERWVVERMQSRENEFTEKDEIG